MPLNPPPSPQDLPGSISDRARVERENRRLLEQDLAARRLVFESRPYQAVIQFSNFCNMSCIMCWDGANPRVQRLSPQVLARIGQEIAPTLSLVTPHFGSEPLLLTWDDTLRLAREHDLELSLTTNVQFLDEKMFREVEQVTQTLFLSIDTHVPEVLARIRKRARVDEVYRNLRIAARLADERGIECMANVVFMMENAPLLDDTIAFFADCGVPSVHVLQLVEFNGHTCFSDPLLHCTPEYVEHVRQRCIEVARERKMRLLWSVGGHEVVDFRERKIGPAPRKVENDSWDVRHRLRHPGYCLYALKAVCIHVSGEVMPCHYAIDGALRLGKLDEQPFDEIWNGPNARDLRRGMLCDDVPALCATCRGRDVVPPEQHLPFVDLVDVRFGRSLARVDASLPIHGPDHMARLTEAPCIRVDDPGPQITSWFLALSIAGDGEHLETCRVEPTRGTDGVLSLRVPTELWERQETNVGIWWAVFGFRDRPTLAAKVARKARRMSTKLGLLPEEPDGSNATEPVALRGVELRCFVRHEPLERVPDSTLHYADQGFRAVRDLGAAKGAAILRGKHDGQPKETSA